MNISTRRLPHGEWVTHNHRHPSQPCLFTRLWTRCCWHRMLPVVTPVNFEYVFLTLDTVIVNRKQLLAQCSSVSSANSDVAFTRNENRVLRQYSQAIHSQDRWVRRVCLPTLFSGSYLPSLHCGTYRRVLPVFHHPWQVSIQCHARAQSDDDCFHVGRTHQGHQ